MFFLYLGFVYYINLYLKKNYVELKFIQLVKIRKSYIPTCLQCSILRNPEIPQIFCEALQYKKVNMKDCTKKILWNFLYILSEYIIVF